MGAGREGQIHTGWVSHNGIEQATDPPRVLSDIHGKQIDDLGSHAILISGPDNPWTRIFA